MFFSDVVTAAQDYSIVSASCSGQFCNADQSGGFSFYYGTGGGGSTVYLNSTLFDFGFTGGLIFRIGR